MILRVFRALEASLRAQIAKYNADTGLTITIPERSMMECILDNEYTPFASVDDEAMLESLKSQKQRNTDRITWLRTAATAATGEYDPNALIHTLKDMPPNCKEWFATNLREILVKFKLNNFGEVTVYHAFSVSGSHGGHVVMENSGLNEKGQYKHAVRIGGIGGRAYTGDAVHKKYGQNAEGKSNIAVKAGNAVVESGNQYKLTQADISKPKDQTFRTEASNKATSESQQLSNKRNEYNNTNSTCWVVWKCLGYGDHESCPHSTVHYYGDNTQGAKELCYHSEGYKRRNPRKCKCCPTSNNNHTDYECIGTITDKEYKEIHKGNAYA